MKNYDDELDRYDDDEILEAEPADVDDYDEVIEGEYDADHDRSDDRLGRVLDEISELRRNMDADARAADRYRYTPQSEAELYDEINRLRGELADTRRSQSIQAELGRMRGEIERAADEKNAKLAAEIEELRSRLASTEAPAPDAVRTAESPVCEPAEDSALKAVESELSRLREAVAAHGAEHAADICDTARDTASVSVDTTEIMRRVIDLRLAVGRLTQQEFENDVRLLSVYNALTAAKSAVYTTASSLSEKLDAMRRLSAEIAAADDCYIADVVERYNEMAEHILSCAVKREDLAVAAGLGGADKIRSLLTPEGRTAAVKFLALAGAVRGADNVNTAVDKLSELAELKDVIQSGRKKAENEKLCSEILSLNSNLVFAADAASAERCVAEMREKTERLCTLEVREIISLPGIAYDKLPCSVPVHRYVREAVEKAASEGAGLPADGTVSALADATDRLRADMGSGSLLAVLDEIKELQRKIAEAQDGNREAILGKLGELSAGSDTTAADDGAVASRSTPDELNLFLSEIVSLRDELQAYKDEVSNMADRLSHGNAPAASAEAAVRSDGADMGAVMDELASLRADIGAYADDIGDIKAAVSGYARSDTAADAENAADGGAAGDPVLSGIDDIKKMLSGQDGETSGLLAVRDEIMGELGKISAASDTAAGNEILAGIDELKAQLGDLRVYGAAGETGESAPSGNAVSDEITALRADIAAQPTAGDIADLKAEIAALREELSAVKANSATSEDMRALGSEVKAVLAAGGAAALASEDGASAGELAQLREMLSGLAGLPAAIADLKSDMAALRGEVTELREKASVSDAYDASRSERTDELVERIYGDVRTMVEEPDYSVMNEILALREEYQHLKESINKMLPAAGDESRLVSEIESLRDQIFTINMASVSDGENQTYESYNNLIVDSLGEIRDELRTLMQDGAPRDGAAAFDRIENAIAEQKQTQEAIATLLNQTLGQLQKIEEMLRSGAEKAAETAAAVKEPAEENDKQAELLSEIENIKYTLGVIQGNERGEDADLEGSIARLKKELSEVAGIIEEDKKK